MYQAEARQSVSWDSLWFLVLSTFAILVKTPVSTELNQKVEFLEIIDLTSCPDFLMMFVKLPCYCCSCTISQKQPQSLRAITSAIQAMALQRCMDDKTRVRVIGVSDSDDVRSRTQ